MEIAPQMGPTGRLAQTRHTIGVALVSLGRWTLQIVKRSDSAKGFEVLPRRWVVECTFAWLGRCRRLAKDWEKSIESAEAWVLIAHIRRVTRLLATD